jgi:alpha-amylase
MNLLQNNAAPRRNLVLYFQVHQPKRLRHFKFFDIGSGNSLFEDDLDQQIVRRVARECYLPTNELLLKVIRLYPQVKITFSLSGVIIDQLEEHAPEVLHSFRNLAATGCVEFLSETYYHSLACLMPGKEFEVQVLKHSEKLFEHFRVHPSVFRNTELIYNDDLAKRISRLGFQGVMIDGVDRILSDKSPNRLYHHTQLPELKLLLRNYKLSDDIAFRYMEYGKALTADKYLSRLTSLPSSEEVVTLAMDYETFGEHQKKETGIFKFLEDVLLRLARNSTFNMLTAAEAMLRLKPKAALSVPNFISWADAERDLSAWLGNEMQRDAFDSLVNLEFDVKNLSNPEISEQWRRLQISDHFYYMSTKKGSDGSVHNYFSPYPSPYEAFINYMNVLTDFTMRVKLLKTARVEEIRSAKAMVNEWPQSMGMRMTMLSHQEH